MRINNANYTSGTTTAVANTGWTKVLDKNPNRTALLIGNQSATIDVQLSFNSDGSNPFWLSAKGLYDPKVVPQNNIYAQAASSSVNVTAYERGTVIPNPNA